MLLKRIGTFLAVLAVLCLSGGCTYTVPIDPTLPREPLVDRLPVIVGVYYSEDFRTYEYSIRAGPGNHTFKFPVGAASVALFDQLLAGLFDQVKPVDRLPPFSPKEPQVSAVIEPVISGVSAGSLDLRSVNLEYELKLFAPDGAKVASWQVEGLGWSHSSYLLIKNIAGDATQIAMRAVGTGVLSGFLRDPDVKKWLHKAGVTSRNPSP